jgi:tRNA (guanine-N7-)-methyltransferase
MKYKKEYDISLLQEVIKYDREKAGIETILGKNLIVEIGCGNGHFLINKAVENKEINFIGIDKKSERLIRCREKQSKHGIVNIRWVNGDAFEVLKDMFVNGTISGIYMIFPDPWPKRKHHKNRLFKKEFLDVVFDKLDPYGFFIFVTDHFEYYEETQKLISGDDRFAFKKIENPDDFSISVFGDKWKKDDRAYHMIMFGKKND